MVKKIVIAVMAFVLVPIGQFVVARSWFLMDSQEMTNILGAAIPNCDCTAEGDLSCTVGFPSNCTTSADCVGCNDSHYKEKCNSYDAWDWADCVTDPSWTCNPKMIATCTNVSGQWVCTGMTNLTGVNCNGSISVLQCHY